MVSWVTDLFDVLSRLVEFVDFVDEGQVGLLFRGGIPRKREIQYHGEELEQIINEEKGVEEEFGGKIRFRIPFVKSPELPEGYGRKFSNGSPRHPRRYLKEINLRPGRYFKIPFYDKIYMDHNQDRRIFSKSEDMVIVPTKNGGNAAYGFVMIVRIADYYTAYTKGDDYEELIRGKASTISKSFAGDLTPEEWGNPSTHKSIAENTLKELQKFTVERWGIDVKDFWLNPVVINPIILVNYSSNGNPVLPIGNGSIGIGQTQR